MRNAGTNENGVARRQMIYLVADDILASSPLNVPDLHIVVKMQTMTGRMLVGSGKYFAKAAFGKMCFLIKRYA